MQTIHFSMVIHANEEKVWHPMLDKYTCTLWTKEFDAGSIVKEAGIREAKSVF